MTFTDIQNRVLDRLNLTSATATTRVGQSINELYRRLASSLGFDTIERTTATATTTIGNRSLTFGPTPVAVEKILALYNTAYTPALIMDQVTFDTIRNEPAFSDPPTEWAVQLMGAKSVTVFLNSSITTAFTLTADVESNLGDLSGTQVPAFAEDFHDVLIYGAMAIELEKMEKYSMADTLWERYKERTADLRYFIAKSAYLNIVQGINSNLSVARSAPMV